MTWELAAVIVATLAAIVAGLRVVLPFAVKRSDADERLDALEAANVELRDALEAANVELRDRTARLEQFAEEVSGGRRGLPRIGVTR